MDFYGYLMSVKCARTDAEWAREKLQELSEGAPLPSMNFQPHGRGGTVSDRTAMLAMARMRREEHAKETMKDAMQVLNEFKGIIQDSDLNSTARAALWMRWGMKATFREIGQKLGMRSTSAMGMIHEAEQVVRPAIEKL